MDIIQKIKSKKELSSLSDVFIKSMVSDLKIKNTKNIIKETRKELRRVYGEFQIKSAIKKREKYINEIILSLNKKDFNLEAHENILKTHRSTRERLQIYKDIYSKLPKFSSLQDLACGLNPFSLIFLKNKDITYHTYDLECQELSLVKRYFKAVKINFNNFNFEVKPINLLDETPKTKTDIAFIFKFFDILETKGDYKIAERILSETNSKKIIVSFSTKTLSGKSMNHPNRKWFELMLKRLNLEFKILKYENEIFYFVNKA